MAIDGTEYVIEEGADCPCDCGGKLEWEVPGNCTCHISSPCNACIKAPLVCNKCGEEFKYGD